jgi:predicted HicB family RNase H-like nuclease
MKDKIKLGEYKGYYGSINYDEEDNIYYGCITNTTDFVNYHSDTLEELYKCFTEAVDDYIDFKVEIEEYKNGIL